MTDEKRLFGTPGAEYLESTLAAAFERHVEPYYEIAGLREKPVELEEWTVADNRSFMPTVAHVIDHVVEYTADNAVIEEWYGRAEQWSAHPEVVEAFQKAVDILADKIDFWMADKHVASHWVTVDADDQILVDGEPLYSPRPDPDQGTVT